ncbi:hypothetical protein [Candidatus Regiella insecticola]|uniref:hypothetical protein n=1 Tax=Candidatus Regiella insecticola TaxID=138073 RepID=UPI0012FF08F6|nr:hypothetical protein [Candidatus Regiella insecticola]
MINQTRRTTFNMIEQQSKTTVGAKHLYPMNFELRQGGNQSNPRSVVHDRG